MALKLYYLMGVIIIAANARAKQKYKMPEPMHPGFAVTGTDLRKYRSPSSKLVDNGESEWEKSGLFEGDIVISNYRNAVERPGARWPLPVPVCISDEDFDEEDISKIKKGLDEIKAKTCITFRVCRDTDESFVMIRGNSTGCWSLVGRHIGGQMVHLQPEGCLRHGVIIHEFLHALGFYHQHSVPDRDEYVDILWQNIIESKKGNFRTYKRRDTAPLDVIYDYDSVMHYSKKAFSKNKKPTILPKNVSATIGQRYYLSELDAYKVNTYYNCDDNHIYQNEDKDEVESIIDEMNEAFDFIY